MPRIGQRRERKIVRCAGDPPRYAARNVEPFAPPCVARRTAALLVGGCSLAAAIIGASGCSFEADYTGGRYTCSDGVCPSALVCNSMHVCVSEVHDAAIDTPKGDAVDAAVHALTCADAGTIPASGTVTWSTMATAGHNAISASCNGTVMNGYEDVYGVVTTAGQHIHVSISGSYAVNAYVITPCMTGTPTCEGNQYASMGNPIVVTPVQPGPHFVIVDSQLAAVTGSYALTVTLQ